MKRKYFMRGMGIGITVTALLFTIGLILKPSSSSMSEEEIKREAAKLGMVMATELNQNSDGYDSTEAHEVASTASAVQDAAADAQEAVDAAKAAEAAAAEEKSAANEAKDEANDTVRQTVTETTDGQDASSSSVTPANASTSSSSASSSVSSTTAASASSSSKTGTQSTSTTGETVQFTVRAGENSATIGANLFKEGLVDDATKFDRYLEQNNYDNRLQNGQFAIPKGASYEEIAKILTRT